MKTYTLALLLPLLIGIAIFATRRVQHTELKSQHNEQSASLQTSTKNNKNLTAKQNSRTKIDPDFLRKLSYEIFQFENDPSLLNDEKEVRKKIERARQQLSQASSADLQKLIPADFNFEDTPRDTPEGFFVSLILNLTKTEKPSSYLDFMTASSITPFAFSNKSKSLTDTMIQWAHQSPDEAYSWYQENLQKKTALFETKEFQSQRLNFLASATPELAINEILSIEVDNDKDASSVFNRIQFSGDEPELDQITRILSAFDSQASNHLNSKRFADLKHNYIADIASGLAARGFKETSTYLDQHFDKLDKNTFFRQISSQQLSETKAWLDYATENNIQPYIIGDLVKRWTKSDPTSAGLWLTEQNDSPGKEAATYEYANSIAEIDPSIAQQWAETLPDSNKYKKRVLRKIQKKRKK